MVRNNSHAVRLGPSFSACAFSVNPSYFEKKTVELEMWANAQRDGRPAEYRWRPLFNAAKFG